MVDGRYPTHAPRRRRALRRALQAAVVAAALGSGSAWAAEPFQLAQAGPDQLAQTIDQNLAGIEFRAEFAPQRTVHELNEQKRQLRMLEGEAPGHRMIPELTERVERLEAQLAELLEDQPADPGAPAEPAPGLVGPTAPPAEVTDRLREVDRWLSEAEAGLLQGQADAAAEHLGRADELVVEIEREYADEIPAGHVPLMVAKERLAHLREQVQGAQ